jgi:lipid II:glycine glycyltransferase (peptidoglycan interpeptide bridge formation enzyme)
MQVVQHLNEDLWKDFVDHNPRGNIFHTPEMFQVFAKTGGHRPELWAVVDGGSEVLALMTPVHVTLMDGRLQRFTTRPVVYGSVLCKDVPRGQDALRLMLDTYAKNAKGQSLFTELRNLHDLSDMQSLLEGFGYVYEDHLNYLIDLDRPTEEILQSIGKRTRKKIRKGLRDGHVQIAEATNRAELAHWYEILQKTYSNAQVPLADRSLFEAAFDVLYPKGMARFLLAQVQGETAACSIELPYKDTIYGWYGGSDRAYSEYLPNEMLIWHILEWGASNSYRVYDFGGAGKPDEEYGVRDFKAKFGGQLVGFGRNTWVHSPSRLKLSKLGYNLYQRFL